MEEGDNRFNDSTRAETGDAGPNVNEKSEIASPDISQSSTFKSTETGSTSSTIFQRAQTIAGWLLLTFHSAKPHVDKGKIESVVETLESCKEGYPRLACYLDSDDCFSIYRRFGVLHARVLLQKQDELRALEEELRTSDNQDYKTPEGQLALTSRTAMENRKPPSRFLRPKKEVLADIERKLLEYGALLQQAQTMVNMNKPHGRDHRSVSNYVANNQYLIEAERGFIYRREDLVTLRGGRENAWLDAAIEKVLQWWPCSPLKTVFSTEDNRRKSSDKYIHYFSRTRINVVATLIITTLILVLLVLPVWGLFTLSIEYGTVKSDASCIGVLLVSTLIFSCVISAFTRARRHEILAAAAAYCAVLVVFMGGVGNNVAIPT